MDELVNDMRQKGLVDIVRKPRSEKLVELIRSTRAIPGGWLYWLEYGRMVRN